MVPSGAESPHNRIHVATDHPLLACMGSQYAGWQIAEGEYFAMGSGPMRVAAAREELIREFEFDDSGHVAVGVLETAEIPGEDVCKSIAEACRVPPAKLTLLVARTASIAGTIQVVARSLETALHKLHELGYDLRRIDSGSGSAPLPTVAADDLTGIGYTNDAVLYGAMVTVYVRDEDEAIEQFGPQVPSSASRDYGRPFAEIFEGYDRDFYRIDPHLFSPAVVCINNLASGRSFQFGEPRPDLLTAAVGGQAQP